MGSRTPSHAQHTAALHSPRLPGPSCDSPCSRLHRHAGTRLSAILRPAFRRCLGETRPEGALPVLLFPVMFCFFPTGPKGWHQRYSLAVLCFSCDLRSWHQGTARQSPADHRGRERLSLGGIKQTKQKKNTTQTQKLLKKRSFFKWTFIQSPTQRHQKDGNSFGFLLPATWDTQKGQSCCFSLAHRHGQWPGLKTWKLRAQTVRQLPAAPLHARGGTQGLMKGKLKQHCPEAGSRLRT